MIQHFFYSILAEFDTDHTFTKGKPVSFQVMPNNNGLDLLISKATESNNAGGPSLEQMLNQKAQDNKQDRGFFDLNADDDAKTNVDPLVADNRNAFSSTKEANDYWKFQTSQCYQFKDLGDVVELADSLRADNLASSLYLFKNTYFLKLTFLDEYSLEIKPADAWAIANEYGIKVTDEQMKIVQEEGKCILERDALGNLRHYFNKTSNY